MKNNFENRGRTPDPIPENGSPSTRVMIPNPICMNLMRIIADELKKLTAKAKYACTVSLALDEMYNFGLIRLEAAQMPTLDAAEFATILAMADFVDIYPLADGRIRCEISLYQVFITTQEEEN